MEKENKVLFVLKEGWYDEIYRAFLSRNIGVFENVSILKEELNKYIKLYIDCKGLGDLSKNSYWYEAFPLNYINNKRYDSDADKKYIKLNFDCDSEIE